tara:strand:+ start:66 stop:896 length:831 start_codon:yes stop_codon:yes gene_type:complete
MKKKFRHNKKRNTAFLYEVLIRNLVKNVVKKDLKQKKVVINIIKEFFNKDTILYREMQLYKALCEQEKIDKKTAEKIISEVKRKREKLDNEEIFSEQSDLIKKMNKAFAKSVFSSFVPNYKNLATISQIFGDKMTIKNKILLEQEIVDEMTEEKQKVNMPSIDKLVFKTFVKKFNDSYGTSLLKEQKRVLNEYILSFSDNGLSFKTHLNEELSRLKKEVEKALTKEEVREDPDMLEKTKEVLNILEGFKEEKINDAMLKRILKIQKLISEIDSHDN